MTETLPAATVTQTTEIHITETVPPVTSTSIMTQSITLDPTTHIETSIEVCHTIKLSFIYLRLLLLYTNEVLKICIMLKHFRSRK